LNRKPFVRFEAFTAVTMKKAVFWDLAPCLCGGLLLPVLTVSLLADSYIFFFYPEDGGDTFLRNFG
jgi:hypothetical protein